MYIFIDPHWWVTIWNFVNASSYCRKVRDRSPMVYVPNCEEITHYKTLSSGLPVSVHHHHANNLFPPEPKIRRNSCDGFLKPLTLFGCVVFMLHLCGQRIVGFKLLDLPANQHILCINEPREPYGNHHLHHHRLADAVWVVYFRRYAILEIDMRRKSEETRTHIETSQIANFLSTRNTNKSQGIT